MATIVKERIVNVVLFYSILGNRLSCTLHYGCDTAIATDSPNKLQNAWQTACLAAFEAGLSDEVQFDRIYTYAIVKEVARTGTDQLSGQVGELSDAALPSNVAAVFQLRQNDVSSKCNGRFFLSGITEAQVVDGLITAAAITNDLTPIGTALLTEITDADGRKWNLVALQKNSGGAPITPVGHTVATIHVSRSPATQRRRKTELQSYDA